MTQLALGIDAKQLADGLAQVERAVGSLSAIVTQSDGAVKALNEPIRTLSNQITALSISVEGISGGLKKLDTVTTKVTKSTTSLTGSTKALNTTLSGLAAQSQSLVGTETSLSQALEKQAVHIGQLRTSISALTESQRQQGLQNQVNQNIITKLNAEYTNQAKVLTFVRAKTDEQLAAERRRTQQLLVSQVNLGALTAAEAVSLGSKDRLVLKEAAYAASLQKSSIAQAKYASSFLVGEAAAQRLVGIQTAAAKSTDLLARSMTVNAMAAERQALAQANAAAATMTGEAAAQRLVGIQTAAAQSTDLLARSMTVNAMAADREAASFLKGEAAAQRMIGSKLAGAQATDALKRSMLASSGATEWDAAAQQKASIAYAKLGKEQTLAIAINERLNREKVRSIALEAEQILVKQGLIKATATQTAATQGLTAANHQLHSAMRGVSGAAGALWLTYGSMLPLMAAFATVTSTIRAFKVGSSFETEMRFIQGLTRGTSESMDRLSESVLYLAETTIYTPTQIVQGLRVLSQAGLSVEQSMQAILPVMRLARIGEMEVAEAANVAQASMHAFGLSAGDVSHIVNTLAQAASMSATNIKEMASALTAASEVGILYGTTLEESTAALTVLAQRHLVGSAAGTAFKNMMRDIGGNTETAKDMVKALGIETHDAVGEMRPMVSVLADIKRALDEFDPESRQQIMKGWMTRRGIRAFVPLVAEAEGFLVEAYAMMLQASEGLPIAESIEEQLTTAFSGEALRAVSKFETTLIRAFQHVDKEANDMIKSFGKLGHSEGFTRFVNTVVSGSVTVANYLMEHRDVVVSLTKAYIALKIAQATAFAFTAVPQFIKSFGALAGIIPQLRIAGLIIGGLATSVVLFSDKASEGASHRRIFLEDLQATYTWLKKAAKGWKEYWDVAVPKGGWTDNTLKMISPVYSLATAKPSDKGFFSQFNEGIARARDSIAGLKADMSTIKIDFSLVLGRITPGEASRRRDIVRDSRGQAQRNLVERLSVGSSETPKHSLTEQKSARYEIELLERRLSLSKEFQDMSAGERAAKVRELEETNRQHLAERQHLTELASMKEAHTAELKKFQANSKIVNMDLTKRAEIEKAINEYWERRITLSQQVQEEAEEGKVTFEDAKRLGKVQDIFDSLANSGSLDDFVARVREGRDILNSLDPKGAESFTKQVEALKEAFADVKIDPKLYEVIHKDYFATVGFADPQKIIRDTEDLAAKIALLAKNKEILTKEELALYEAIQKRNLAEAHAEATGQNRLIQLMHQHHLIGKSTVYAQKYNDSLLVEKLRTDEATRGVADLVAEYLRLIRVKTQKVDLDEREAQFQRQLGAQRQSLNLSLATSGSGSAEAEHEARVLSIRQQYEERHAKLLIEGRDDQAAQELEHRDQMVQLAEDEYLQKEALMGDWRAGASRALRDYAHTAKDVYTSVGNLAADSFKKMEDAFVDFVKTGKFEWEGLVEDILIGLLRIQIQQQVTGVLAGALSGMFQTGGGAATTSAGSTTTSSNLYSNSVDMGYYTPAQVRHAGGVVGSGSVPVRNVPTTMFDHAPRLHNGLASDEFPAILQRGEEVVPRGQGGSSGGLEEIKVEIYNNGQPAQVSDAEVTFDFKRAVVGIWLEGYEDDTMGLKSAIRGNR